MKSSEDLVNIWGMWGFNGVRFHNCHMEGEILVVVPDLDVQPRSEYITITVDKSKFIQDMKKEALKYKGIDCLKIHYKSEIDIVPLYTILDSWKKLNATQRF